MKKTLYLLGGIVAVVALAGGVAAAIGSRLPRSHVASGTRLLPYPPDRVYAVVRDFQSAPAWRGDVKSVEVFTDPDGTTRFRETGKHGVVNYELVEDKPGERIVTRILDTDLGYAGSWTYAFVSEAGGTRVTITENGEVSNVLFRFMSRYVFSQTATIEACLAELEERLKRP